MEEYKLQFNGYWRHQNRAGIPHEKGVYLVYRAVYNEQENTVGLKDIIYIGKANDLNERILNHDKHDEFMRTLQKGEELCYSCADVKWGLDEVENALIFAQKPVLNDLLKDSYLYSTPVKFKIEGNCILLKYTDFRIG